MSRERLRRRLTRRGLELATVLASATVLSEARAASLTTVVRTITSRPTAAGSVAPGAGGKVTVAAT